MFRRSNGFAYIINRNTTAVADTEFFFGIGGDIPLAGDWDGDGKDTLSIYRPSENRFYVSNSLRTQFADFDFEFALPGSRPFAGDFNGDGRDDLALYRPCRRPGRHALPRQPVRSRRPHVLGRPPKPTRSLPGIGRAMGSTHWPGTTTAEGMWYFRLANHQLPPEHVLRAGPVEAEVTPVVGRWVVPAD